MAAAYLALGGVFVWAFLVYQSTHHNHDDSLASALVRILVSFYGITASLGEFRLQGTNTFAHFIRVATRLAEVLNLVMVPLVCAGRGVTASPLMVFTIKAAAPAVLIFLVGLGLVLVQRVCPGTGGKGGTTAAKGNGKGSTRKGAGRPMPLRSKLVGALVWVLYYLFPTIVTDLFKVFQCTQEIDGKRYLLSDLSPVVILHSTFLDWTPCFSQPWTGFSFPRICFAIP